MIENEIDQYIELINIINEIIEEDRDINIYWENSIEIEINKIIIISDIIEFWDLDDSIRRNDWLRLFSF